MTRKELEEIITNGENSTVEFTNVLDKTSQDDLAKEIVALANLQGGRIFIGVGDDKSIIGCQKEKIEEWIMNICRDNVEPSIIPIYEKVMLEDKKVIIISIPYLPHCKPYAVRRSGNRIYYIRVGTTSRGATTEEVIRLAQAASKLQFDKTPVLNCTYNDLNIENIKDYYQKFYSRNISLMKEEEIIRFLLTAGLLTCSEENYLATIAGLLLFGKQPENFLMQCCITLAHISGTDLGTGKLLSTQRFNASISQNVDTICEHIANIIPKPAKIVKTIRIEKEIYPYKIIREAVVNAVVHRDYTIPAQIRLFLFDDRLEIRSPGKLPNGVTIEEIKVGRSVIRNPLLFQFMSRMGYIEALGSGIPMIIATMKNLGRKEPDIIENNEVTLILYPPEEGI